MMAAGYYVTTFFDNYFLVPFVWSRYTGNMYNCSTNNAGVTTCDFSVTSHCRRKQRRQLLTIRRRFATARRQPIIGLVERCASECQRRLRGSAIHLAVLHTRSLASVTSHPANAPKGEVNLCFTSKP